MSANTASAAKALRARLRLSFHQRSRKIAIDCSTFFASIKGGVGNATRWAIMGLSSSPSKVREQLLKTILGYGMGYRVSWIARSGTSTKELLDASRRNLTGERHDFPDVGFYLLELPKAVNNPWVVLIADGSDHFADLDDSLAQSLSKGGNETLYFWCSDTVMATELMCFKDGAINWSIQYDCEEKTKQPAIHGDVPATAQDLLAGLRAKQQADSGADYIYDLTAELGRKLVGFRHDMDPEGDDPEPFQVLAR